MKIHSRIPSIGATLIAFIIATFILLLVKECHAWTEHEFQVRLSGGNAWKITSLPESIEHSDEYNMAGKLGYLSHVYAVREDRKWDPELMYVGPIAVDETGRKWAKMKMRAMMKALDKTLPHEEIVVVLFVTDYIEMSVFFSPDRWKNKEFHVKTAKKLNIERKKWTDTLSKPPSMSNPCDICQNTAKRHQNKVRGGVK